MRNLSFLPLIAFALILHSCAEEGCIDINACNFNLDADVDDGSCYYPGDDCDDGDESTTYDVYANNCQCEGFNPGISGCTSDDACNYNADATEDDGTCYYPGDPCDDGDSSTTNDAYNANCDCVGTPPTDSGCAVNADGNIPVTFGVMTDQWSEECSYRIFWTGDETVATDWIFATTDDAINSATWLFSPGYWTMEVNDDYGDGKTENGYYFAECQTASGATEVLFTTAFTDGFESQTDFELTNGIIGPPFVDENN